jgi:hypothetical protein
VTLDTCRQLAQSVSPEATGSKKKRTLSGRENTELTTSNYCRLKAGSKKGTSASVVRLDTCRNARRSVRQSKPAGVCFTLRDLHSLNLFE